MILIATQCFPPKLGGIEVYMAGLADALTEAGRRCAVFADGEADASDAGRPYPVRRYGGWRPLRSRRKAAAMRAEILEHGVERILTDSWKSLETALIATRGLSARPRLVALAHGMEFPARPGVFKKRRMTRVLAQADAILANSPYTAARARPYLGSQAPLRVATPPIPAQPSAPLHDRAALRARLGATGPLIVALARHEPRKGFDHLIRAAAALASSHDGLRLAIAGDGPDRERLEALAKETGAPTVFLGRISEIEKAALFAEATLFAMPTRAEGDSVEGFGIVYLEAAWHGAPALAGREGGAAAAVKEGETGWLCDGASTEAVQQTLAAILADPVELHRRRFLAQAHARDQLWASRISDFLEA